jgi:putative membrane protein
LAKVKVQTASGNASAEMTIEGMPQFEPIRDFLYTRMRGAKGRPAEVAGAGGRDELAAALLEVAGEVRALRLALAPAASGDD